MTGMAHLLQSYKSIRLKLILLCLGVFIYQMLFTILGASAQIYQGILKDMKDIPPMTEQMMGQGFMEAMMKYGIMAIGYIHPFLLLFFILFIFTVFSQLLTSEINNGSIGFTLSKPLSRLRLFANLGLVIATGLGLMALSGFVAVVIGVPIFHSQPLSLAPFAALAQTILLLMLLLTACISLCAALADSGKQLLTWGGVGLFILYLLNMAAPLWQPLRTLLPVNPFHYYTPLAILMGQRQSLGGVLAQILVSLLIFALATWLFCRRDISEG